MRKTAGSLPANATADTESTDHIRDEVGSNITTEPSTYRDVDESAR